MRSSSGDIRFYQLRPSTSTVHVYTEFGGTCGPLANTRWATTILSRHSDLCRDVGASDHQLHLHRPSSSISMVVGGGFFMQLSFVSGGSATDEATVWCRMLLHRCAAPRRPGHRRFFVGNGWVRGRCWMPHLPLWAIASAEGVSVSGGAKCPAFFLDLVASASSGSI